MLNLMQWLVVEEAHLDFVVELDGAAQPRWAIFLLILPITAAFAR